MKNHSGIEHMFLFCEGKLTMNIGVPLNKIEKFFIVSWVVWCKYRWWCKNALIICIIMVWLRRGKLRTMRIPSCHMCVKKKFAASTATSSSQSNVSIFGAFSNQVNHECVWILYVSIHIYMGGKSIY